MKIHIFILFEAFESVMFESFNNQLSAIYTKLIFFIDKLY